MSKTRTLRLIARFVAWTMLLALFLPTAYVATAIGFSLWPVNRNFESAGECEIFVRSNGVHTDLILPLQRQGFQDWRKHFPISAFAELPARAEYLAIGWGDLGFYLETPNWRDLRFRTAWKALFQKAQSALHVELLSPAQLALQSELYAMRLTAVQAHRLEQFILTSIAEPNLPRADSGALLLASDAVQAEPIAGASYGLHDAFFYAHGHYSMWRTCNSWTAEGLQRAGVAVAAWSPFPFGVTRPLRALNTQAAKSDSHSNSK